MSWLTAVTGRAEDLLNKLDRSAADAFHIEEETGKQPVSLTPVVATGPTHKANILASKSLPSSAGPPSRLSSDTARFGLPSTTSTPKTATKPSPSVSKVTSSSVSPAASAGKSAPSAVKSKDSDEALFDFLNSKDSGEGGSSKKRVTPISSRHHSRQSSTSSTRGGARNSDAGEEGLGGGSGDVGGRGADAGGGASSATVQAPEAEAVAETETQANSHRNSPTGSNESADIEALADAMKESPAASDHSAPDAEGHDGNTRLSALELENRLLKNEVDSLNQEMANVIQRAKDAQTELVKTREKMAAYTDSASLHDQLLREVQAREMDLQEALKAKDSQLAVLRVRLEEGERDVASRRREVESLQADRNRILHDQTSASGIHSQTLDTMRHKLGEVEGTLAREQQAHKQYQQEVLERQGRLEQEQKALAEALTSAEKKAMEEKAKAAEAHGQLKTVKATLESTRQEMAEYKEKATRILQSKERLISSLREGTVGAGTGSEGVSSLEYESVRQERDMLREELQRSKMTVDNLRMELQDLEVQLQQESSTAQDNIMSLEDSLGQEKRRREDAEQELLKQKQELQYAIDELHKQKLNFQTRISDREAEIEKLRNQLTTKSISSTSESELESRVRSLTESLIQKQTMLEALSTEKNSLTLQLERLGQQYRDVENTLMRSTIASVNVGDHDDDVRQRLPTFMREGATDTEVTRRVKRYVNTIDKFSIRLGVFLRRYPIARIFVIVYIVMLHLWVMVVLMTYQPEMHGKDYLPSEDKH